MKSPSLLARLLLLTVAVALSGTFYLNLCDLMFDCGCRSWWNGAAEMCNINDPESRHCPWCSYGLVAGYLPLALVFIGQIAAVFWPRQMPFALRAGLALAAFPVLGSLTALAYGVASGYWA